MTRLLYKYLGHVRDPIAEEHGYSLCRDCGDYLGEHDRIRWERLHALKWEILYHLPRFRAWRMPCPDCGKRFGRHDPNVDHMPF